MAALALLSCAGCAAIVGEPIDSPPTPASRPTPEAAPEPAAAVTAVPAAPPARARRGRSQGDTRPDSYVVQRGDTLFGIALDFGLDYRELAVWNGIADPSRIFAGQRLKLLAPEARDGSQPRTETGAASAAQVQTPRSPDAVVARSAGAAAEPPATASDKVPMLSEPRAVTLPWSEQALAQLGVDGGGGAKTVPGERQGEAAAAGRGDPRPAAKGDTRGDQRGETGGDGAPAAAPRAAAARPDGRVDGPGAPAVAATPSQTGEANTPNAAVSEEDWMWPARGTLAYRFGGAGALKGLGIAGKAGSPVVAAAPGRVVYSGSGLRGYGKLVIIKHNDEYLTVYAHNQALLVKEGEQVKRGQRIAEMGDSDSERVALHFELRRFGRPVDPLTQLPGERPPS